MSGVTETVVHPGAAASSPASVDAPDTAALDSEIVVRLRVALGRISRRMLQRSPMGLSPTELSVLINLKVRGPSRLGELAGWESVAAPSMTRIAASMLSKGLIVRRPDPEDGRSVRVELTEKGSAALEAEKKERTQMVARRLASLTPDQLTAIVRALPVLERLAADED